MKKKDYLRYFLFTIITAFLFGIFFTGTDFITAPFFSVKDFLVLFSQWAVICLALWCLLSVLAINRYVFLVVFPVLVLISSVLAYFRYTSNTILTSMILDVTLNNDARTSWELITMELVLFVFASLSIALAIVYYRFKKVRVHTPILFLVGFTLLFWRLLTLPGVQRPLSERIPFNLYYVTSRYLSEKELILEERISLADKVECQSTDSLIVVFILGESLRADHMSINGYERETTPRLSKEDVISFPNIYSEYTFTNRSLAHILSRADSLHPHYAFEERSFVDLFKRCDFYTSWLANQEPAESYVYFMNECDTLAHVNIDKSSYVFDKWTDGDLLPLLDTELQKEKEKHLIIMHTIGSHWYYNSHYTDEFQKFTPITKSRVVSSCTHEEMINSYDNTVLYTDFFLWSVIERLRDKNALLIYLSDHGESLGENGIWLHAVDSPPARNPACFVWMSPPYKEKHPGSYERFTMNRMQRFRTDFLYPTITLASGITGEIISEDMSFFRKFE